MEWLKEKGIRQTFTSTYDSQANGVAERWINLIKTKSTALLALRYLRTPFWCYAVAWVTRCYNNKVLGQKPRKNLPEFGQFPGRTYIRRPPPSPISDQKAFSRGGGWGCIF